MSLDRTRSTAPVCQVANWSSTCLLTWYYIYCQAPMYQILYLFWKTSSWWTSKKGQTYKTCFMRADWKSFMYIYMYNCIHVYAYKYMYIYIFPPERFLALNRIKSKLCWAVSTCRHRGTNTNTNTNTQIQKVQVVLSTWQTLVGWYWLVLAQPRPNFAQSKQSFNEISFQTTWTKLLS